MSDSLLQQLEQHAHKQIMQSYHPVSMFDSKIKETQIEISAEEDFVVRQINEEFIATLSNGFIGIWDATTLYKKYEFPISECKRQDITIVGDYVLIRGNDITKYNWKTGEMCGDTKIQEYSLIKPFGDENVIIVTDSVILLTNIVTEESHAIFITSPITCLEILPKARLLLGFANQIEYLQVYNLRNDCMESRGMYFATDKGVKVSDIKLIDLRSVAVALEIGLNPAIIEVWDYRKKEIIHVFNVNKYGYSLKMCTCYPYVIACADDCDFELQIFDVRSGKSHCKLNGLSGEDLEDDIFVDRNSGCVLCPASSGLLFAQQLFYPRADRTYLFRCQLLQKSTYEDIIFIFGPNK